MPLGPTASSDSAQVLGGVVRINWLIKLIGGRGKEKKNANHVINLVPLASLCGACRGDGLDMPSRVSGRTSSHSMDSSFCE